MRNCIKYEQKSPTKFGFLTIISLAELLERFAYYGLVSLLIIFLTLNLGFSDTKAYATSSLFVAIGFGVPIIGGILADNDALKLKDLITIGAIIALIGYGLMFFLGNSEKNVAWSLAFIAVGTGFFKGNLTVLLGSCYEKNDNKRNHGFTVFYTCINVGTLISTIMCGYAANQYGSKCGFAVAGLGMTLSLLIFRKYQSVLQQYKNSARKLSKIPKPLTLLTLTLLLIASAFALQHSVKSSQGLLWLGILLFLYYVYRAYKANTRDRAKLLVLMLILPFLIAFYSLQSQLYFVINLFAKRNLETNIFGHAIPSTAFQSIAPTAAIIFGIILSHILSKSEKYQNTQASFMRFGLGLIGPMLCFAILYFGSERATQGKVHYLYMLSLGFIGAAEALVGPFAYNQATLLAPTHMKGHSMSIVLVAIAFSNLSTVLISKLTSLNDALSFDCLKSINVYKAGFFNLSLIQLAVCVVFFLSYFLLRNHINAVHNTSKSKKII